MEKGYEEKQSVLQFREVRKTFYVLCSGTAVARLTVEETLYKYTWAVLQGWVEEQQYAADAVVNFHNKHQSPGRPSQKQ